MIKSHGNKLICRIDVTGFGSVMVALVGLFFLQVSAIPDMPRNVAELPKAVHSVLLPRARWEDALTITIKSDGQIWFRESRVSISDLPKRLRDGVHNGAERRVYIKGDAGAKYRTVKEVLEQIRLAGIENVSFLTNPLEAASRH